MPQNLDFLDIDVDRGEMGGNLTWMAPTDPTHVTWNAFGAGYAATPMLSLQCACSVPAVCISSLTKR